MRLEELLIKSLDSLEAGNGFEVNPIYWQRKRQELLARSAARDKLEQRQELFNGDADLPDDRP